MQVFPARSQRICQLLPISIASAGDEHIPLSILVDNGHATMAQLVYVLVTANKSGCHHKLLLWVANCRQQKWQAISTRRPMLEIAGADERYAACEV